MKTNIKKYLVALIAVLPLGIYAQYDYEPFSDGAQSNGFYDERYIDNEPQYREADRSGAPMRAGGNSNNCAGKLCPFCGSDFLDSDCQCPYCGYDGGSTLSTPTGNPILPMLIMALMFGVYRFVKNRRERKKNNNKLFVMF